MTAEIRASLAETGQRVPDDPVSPDARHPRFARLPLRLGRRHDRSGYRRDRSAASTSSAAAAATTISIRRPPMRADGPCWRARSRPRPPATSWCRRSRPGALRRSPTAAAASPPRRGFDATSRATPRRWRDARGAYAEVTGRRVRRRAQTMPAPRAASGRALAGDVLAVAAGAVRGDRIDGAAGAVARHREDRRDVGGERLLQRLQRHRARRCAAARPRAPRDRRGAPGRRRAPPRSRSSSATRADR